MCHIPPYLHTLKACAADRDGGTQGGVQFCQIEERELFYRFFPSPSGNDRGKYHSGSKGRRYLNTRVSRGKKCTREVYVVCVFPIALSLCLKKRKDSPVQVRWVVVVIFGWFSRTQSISLSRGVFFFVTHVRRFLGVCVWCLRSFFNLQ